MLRQVLKQLKDKPFSEQQMRIVTEKKANIVLYPDIANYQTINKLLGRNGAAIILYVTQVNDRYIVGHWTCLFKAEYEENTIEFFDPYGYYPDDQLYFTQYQYPPYLTYLLEKCKYNINYNIHALQDRNNKNISTCGRHVSIRLNFRYMPLPQYSRMLESSPCMSPDDIVTLMTAFVG